MNISPENRQTIIEGVQNHLNQRGRPVDENQVRIVVDELTRDAQILTHIVPLVIKEIIRPLAPSQNPIENGTSYYENS